MPTVYRRSDTGSPTYSFASGYQYYFNAIKEVLKGCLVNGYNNKPGAGWTLVAEGAQYLILRNGTQSGYLCLSWSNTGYFRAQITLAETYTGVANNIITGDGVKTGVAANNASPQAIAFQYIANVSAYHDWYVIADERTFVFQMAGFYNASAGVLLDGSSQVMLYGGEDSAGNFIAMGGQNNGVVNANNYFSASGFTSLRDPATGLLVDVGSLAVITPSLSLTMGSPAMPALSVAELVPVRWYGGGVEAGRLRGLAQVPALMAVTVDKSAPALGMSGTLTVSRLSEALTLGDSNTYLMGCTYLSAFRLATNNPSFW
ncbi:hypothetical protein QA447_03565 [Pseudomonas sp. abacavir_1]